MKIAITGATSAKEANSLERGQIKSYGQRLCTSKPFNLCHIIRSLILFWLLISCIYLFLNLHDIAKILKKLCLLLHRKTQILTHPPLNPKGCV